MENFKNKIIIVTGAGSGIGRGISEKMAELGAKVIISDLNFDKANIVANNIISNSGYAKAVQTDTTNYEEVEKLINNTVGEFGQIDYIFNNAGIGISAEFQNISMAEWHKVLNVNLMGMIYGTEIAYKIMVKQGFGHIVNTASLAGLIPFPTAVPYSTTKMAVVGMSRSLRIEGEKYGVKVSAICPGFIETNIYESAIRKASVSQLMTAITVPIIPLNQAVDSIIKGVAKNKDLIIFPLYGKLLWLFDRLIPAIVTWVGRDSINRFRKLNL